MSNTKNNGGPAFPVPLSEHQTMASHHANGMTLRDYFAAKAMQAMLIGRTPLEMLSLYDHGADGRSKLAIDAYLFADTMLKAREQ